MAKRKYDRVVKALGIAIFLVELAMALSALLFVFTLEDSIRILSIIGLFSDEMWNGLLIVWPAVGLTAVAVVWCKLVFVNRAQDLFGDAEIPIEAFGTCMADERREMIEINSSLTRFAIFAAVVGAAALAFIYVGFINVLLAGLLILGQFTVLILLRDMASLLRADAALLT